MSTSIMEPAAAVTSNPRGDRPIQVATRPDGSNYRYEVISHTAERRIYADTMTAIVNELIEGYADVETAGDADMLRLLDAVQLQVEMQAHLVLYGNRDALTPEQLAIATGHRNTPPEIDAWRHEDLPLVLVSTYYEPVGELPVPDSVPGSIIWLDPTDEETFVYSLHEAGVIDLAMSVAEPDAIAASEVTEVAAAKTGD